LSVVSATRVVHQISPNIQRLAFNASRGHVELDGYVMSDKHRYYASGVREALFLLSRGRCYEPGCQVGVLRQVDGDPIVNVHIAHICAHSKDGPRFREMPLKERDSFNNLILLCKAHHTPVDRKSNEKKYPEELLRRWKSDREGNFAVQLSGLDGLDEEKLQEMMADAVTETKREITDAVDEQRLTGILPTPCGRWSQRPSTVRTWIWMLWPPWRTRRELCVTWKTAPSSYANRRKC
jgi:hypothetical protein